MFQHEEGAKTGDASATVIENKKIAPHLQHQVLDRGKSKHESTYLRQVRSASTFQMLVLASPVLSPQATRFGRLDAGSDAWTFAFSPKSTVIIVVVVVALQVETTE